MFQRRVCGVLALAALLITGCAGGQNSSPPPPPPAGITVSVSPGTATVRGLNSQQFTATVTGTANTAVTWSVNGVAGGDATVGTVTNSGLYTAPAAAPSPNTVSVQATSIADISRSGASSVTLQNPIPVLSSNWPQSLGVGPFTLFVRGSKFITGAQVLFDGAPLTTTYVDSSFLIATGTTTNTQGGARTVVVRNPDPGAANSNTLNAQVSVTFVESATAAARFLEQAAFGPTPALMNHVRYVGIRNFLADQFNAPMSSYEDPVPDSNGQFTNPDILQRRWFRNALFEPDQLRQRVALAG